MTRLHFQHLRETENIGDRWCSPYDHFQWEAASVSDVRHADTPDHDVGIYGGGKIFRGLATYAGVRPGGVNIAWGVGTVQSFPISWRYAKARRRMTLIGSRDWGDTRYAYAPCPSCASPLFDTAPAPTHDVVFYAHGGKTSKQKITIPEHIPHRTNTDGTLADAIAFLASGATVVSNSYHGVYWGLLLGRKVLCIPFSKKFTSYRLPPGYATPGDWQAQLKTAQAHPEMLDLSRAATQAFKDRVETVIDQFGR